MYCSSCGQSVNRGLSYCKHFGTKVSDAKERDASKLSEELRNFLLAGILGIPIAGVGVIIGLMSVMKQIGFSNVLIIIFTSLVFVLLLIAEVVFVWSLLQNRARTVKETRDNIQLKEVEIKRFNQAQVRELPEPMPSVTENTTRSFEVIHRKVR